MKSWLDRAGTSFALALLVTSALLLAATPAATNALTCTTTYNTSSNVPAAELVISSPGVYCFDAGTYNTQITVTSGGVTLTGAPGTSASSVVIQPSNVVDNAYDGGPENPIIYVSSSSNVVVEGLTVDGAAGSAEFTNCGGGTLGLYIGILYTASSGTITGVTVENLYQASPSLYGCQSDAGLEIVAGGGSTVTISGNTVVGYQKGGIVCWETGTTCVISDNNVAPLPAAAAANGPNGIQIGPGGGAAVTGNTVSGNVCGLTTVPPTGYPVCGPDMINSAQGTGIVTYEASSPTTISGNIITGNDVGIYMADDTTTVTPTSNSISGSTYTGITVYDESQTVTGNSFSGEPVGIEVVSDTSGLTAVATVSGNTFSSVSQPYGSETVTGSTALFEQVVQVTATATLTASSTLTTTTTVTTTEVPLPPPPPVLSASCTGSTVVVGKTVACGVAVLAAAQAPTGKVSWSSSLSGRFSKTYCRLVAYSTFSACAVNFTPTEAGTVVISANYPGDANNPASSGTFTLAVTQRQTTTVLRCSRSSVAAGSSATVRCIARVTGYSPTGTVTWTQTGPGSVTFSSTSCTLSRGSCTVSLTGSTAGAVSIQASYSGDTNNLASSSTASLTVT